jgi:hypothetical protein
MSISEIAEILNAEILCTIKNESRINISMACGADLMSDVLAFIKSETLLFTGLTTPQVVYTAENSGVKVVCFVRGKKPNADTITLAKEKEIILLAAKNGMFECCGKLYQKGIIGCFETSKQRSYSYNNNMPENH